jgi:hypothetical protein
MAKILEVFADTGEVIERDRTEEETAQHEADLASLQELQDLAAAKAQADTAATAAAIAHAKSLGFTDAMIAVMYPNLGAQSD